MPITNSLAFLFTVLGEWWAEGKVIHRGKTECWGCSDAVERNNLCAIALDTWIGMSLVLGGIALCVHSKTPS